jgi:hypothetical protein
MEIECNPRSFAMLTLTRINGHCQDQLLVINNSHYEKCGL